MFSTPYTLKTHRKMEGMGKRRSSLPLTSPVLVAEVREAPHVAQADDGAGHRQNELHLVAPLTSLLHLLFWGRQHVLDTVVAIMEARFSSWGTVRRVRTGRLWRSV